MSERPYSPHIDRSLTDAATRLSERLSLHTLGQDRLIDELKGAHLPVRILALRNLPEMVFNQLMERHRLHVWLWTDEETITWDLVDMLCVRVPDAPSNSLASGCRNHLVERLAARGHIDLPWPEDRQEWVLRETMVLPATMASRVARAILSGNSTSSIWTGGQAITAAITQRRLLHQFANGPKAEASGLLMMEMAATNRQRIQSAERALQLLTELG